MEKCSLQKQKKKNLEWQIKIIIDKVLQMGTKNWSTCWALKQKEIFMNILRMPQVPYGLTKWWKWQVIHENIFNIYTEHIFGFRELLQAA